MSRRLINFYRICSIVVLENHSLALHLGDLVEYGATDKIFTVPEKKQTEDYITGRYG